MVTHVFFHDLCGFFFYLNILFIWNLLYYTCEARIQLGCKNFVRFQTLHGFPVVLIFVNICFHGVIRRVRRKMAGACLHVQGQSRKEEEARLGHRLQMTLGRWGAVPREGEAGEPLQRRKKEGRSNRDKPVCHVGGCSLCPIPNQPN